MAPIYPPGWQGPGKPLKPVPQTSATQKPTSNFNFTTAGTGTAGTGIKFNFGTGNPFGPGYILPSSAVNGFEWKVNQEQQFASKVNYLNVNRYPWQAKTLFQYLDPKPY